MDSFVTKIDATITPTTEEYEDLFLVSPGREVHFERMINQSKFVNDATKTEQKAVLEWIKHSSSDIKLMTGACVYFNVPKPCVCTFTDVEIKKSEFGLQMYVVC